MNTAQKRDLRSREQKRHDAALDTRPRTTVSFYRYVRLADPQAFRDKLFAKWSELDCMGRIYVASEGINAQMNVPDMYWDQFDAWVQNQPELKGIPYKIAVEEGEAPSFFKLTIKVRPKIVADGLDDSTFDVTNTGAYLTAAQMNEYVDDPGAVVFDMRNNYEAEVGHFAGAITPDDFSTFRDELKNTPELLKEHKDKKVAIYCTGGIRCEKASAWLKHNGFKDVKHLKGGIIDYKRQVEEQGLENKFRGKNFVFDERLGERISDEVISTCHLCKTNKCDTHHHCKNQICHQLFIGCDDCIEKRKGYCSWKCAQVDKIPQKYKKPIARWYNQLIRKRRPFQKTRLQAS
ncbi:MAG: rhodanese-related sulfurtransferase [Candidatus Kaiserbacteria bacterium]|nr:rhodanese-related sulfurtransferase [Candidatus Kaiserbacteria bacterium]MCB9815773.1 rhodanese-related sulfurtransferase [Candidatus Nomurabacteria bacterium]